MPHKTNLNRIHFSPLFFISTIVVCIIPTLLNWMGIYFGLDNYFVNLENINVINELQAKVTLSPLLASKFTHTLLVGSSITIAFLTGILSFVDYSIKKNVSTPIVGVALFCAGMLDVVHILSADQLINLQQNTTDITSFTWLFSRSFHALILILGVGIFLIQRREFLNQEYRSEKYFVLFISIIFFLLAINAILIVTDEALHIPVMSFPNSVLSHPYDLVPLLLYLIAGLFIFPKFYKQNPSTFSQTLLLCLIPAVFAQLHMAFGSKVIFDNHFYIAHFLKLFSYLIPFIGLNINYIETYNQEKRALKELDLEMIEKGKIQNTLQGVLDVSLNGIMVYQTVKDEKNKIIDFTLTIMNPAASTMAQLEVDKVIGKKITELVPGIIHSKLFHDYVSVAESGMPKTFDFHSQTTSKDYRISVVPLNKGIALTFNDITEQKKGQEVLLNFEKVTATSKFARIIAHEIRNPLTNINLAVEQLKAEPIISDDQSTYFDILTRNTNRINLLIADLLNSSKQTELHFENISVAELIAQTLKEAEDRIQLKQIRVNQNLDQKLILNVDIEKIKIAILNIIINGIEAMKKGEGELEIKTLIQEENIQISIADNGSGISDEALEKLFEPFYSSKPKGFGIGLTSAQNIIFNHKGTIQVNSKLGIGTQFIINLPTKQ